MADTTPPKKKKLPFKPTALRKPAVVASSPTPSSDPKTEDDDNDDCLDLFRRSKEMAPIVAADRERRLRKKQRKEEEERERRQRVSEKMQLEHHDVLLVNDDLPRESGSGDVIPTEPVVTKTDSFSTELATPPPSKRTRLSASASATKLHSSAQSPDQFVDKSPSSRRLRSQYKAQSSGQQSTSTCAVISLDSDDEDVKPVVTPIKSRPRSRSSIELVEKPSSTQSQEDDEFAEYIKKAEEQRAKQKQQQKSSSSNTKKAQVQVLVTSPIDGTKPCGFAFLFDKQFLYMRNAWVAYQAKHNIAVPPEDDLVLTWQRRKVYNFSTLFDLGLRPNGQDGVSTNSSHNRKGLSDDGTQVHMEIMTSEVFQQWEEEDKLRRQREVGDVPYEEDEETELQPEAPEVKLKVFLKARDSEAVGLTVRPGTTVETLVTAFRAQRDTSDKEVTLWWDGDMLEEHVTMEDAEIDDMDTIEVYIK